MLGTEQILVWRIEMKKEYRSNEERIFAGFRRFNKILKRQEFGHHGQTRILNILVEKGAVSQRDLQEEVEITSSSASELLTKMEDHGLIKRTPDPANAKSLIVEITEDGKKRAEQLNAEKAEKTKKLFAALSDAEKEQFAEMLDKIQASWYDEGLFYGDSRRHRNKHLGKTC